MGIGRSILNFFFGEKKKENPSFTQLFDSLLDSHSPVVFYEVRTTPHFHFHFISDAIIDLVGYTPQEHYNNPQLGVDLVHPDDREKLSSFMTYPENTKLVIKIRFLHRNGSTIFTEHHLQIRKDSITGMILNITEIMDSEKKLRESEERLVVALQSTGIAIWEWDLETSFVTWKNSVEDVLCVKKGVINESIDSYFNLIHPEDYSGFMDTVKKALQTADHYNAEHRIIDQSGAIQWIEAYAEIFRDSSGKTVRWVGTLRNITEKKLQELENRELYDRTRNQSGAIVEMALDESFFSGNLEESLKLILRVGAQVLQASRTSIWMFNEDYSTLECIYVYDLESEVFSLGSHHLVSKDVPKYFDYILNGRVLVSHDSMNDSRTAEFRESYSQKVNLKALMDSGIRVRGKIIGVFSVENIGESRNWKSDEVMFCGLLADQSAIAIINAEKKQSEDQVKLLNKNLEKLVEERTLQLQVTNKDLSKTLENLSKTQNQLILSEKMASLGQLIAGIAHEINNPIGTIKASLELIRIQGKNHFFDPKNLPSSLKELDECILRLCEDFLIYALGMKDIPTGISRRNSIQKLAEFLSGLAFPKPEAMSEKLVDIGIVEIPTKFITLLDKDYSEPLFGYMTRIIFEEKNYDSIETSINRVANLIRSLKNFTHMNAMGEKSLFPIDESVETVITLFHSKLKHGVEIIRNYKPVPTVLCYPDDLMQLWTNLIQNALQAMEFKGTLEICIFPNETRDKVTVEIIDSGKGIAPGNQKKIFEPFFTTKALGEGSGLGLDISRKIVENHNGSIGCESQPGRTTFRVVLPVSGG